MVSFHWTERRLERLRNWIRFHLLRLTGWAGSDLLIREGGVGDTYDSLLEFETLFESNGMKTL